MKRRIAPLETLFLGPYDLRRYFKLDELGVYKVRAKYNGAIIVGGKRVSVSVASDWLSFAVETGSAEKK